MHAPGRSGRQSVREANSVSRSSAVQSILAAGGQDGAVVNKGCFKTLFDNIGILFRCVPRYVYEVEVLVNESICVEKETIEYTDSNGDVQTYESCLKQRVVKKVTTENPGSGNILFDTINTFLNAFTTYATDVENAWPVIVGAGVITTIGFCILISLFRMFSGIFVWFTIIASFLLACSFTIFCFVKAGIISQEIVDKLGDALQVVGLNNTSAEDFLATRLT